MAPYGGHDWRPTHPLLRGRATTIVLKHDPALRGAAKFNFRLSLFTFTSLAWIHDGFYHNVDGKQIKRVPEWIHLYLTPLSIAHWFMQDGSRQAGQGVSFATNSFTHEDTVRLAELLTSMYGLKTSVIKTGKEGQWRISIWKRIYARFFANRRSSHEFIYAL